MRDFAGAVLAWARERKKRVASHFVARFGVTDQAGFWRGAERVAAGAVAASKQFCRVVFGNVHLPACRRWLHHAEREITRDLREPVGVVVFHGD